MIDDRSLDCELEIDGGVDAQTAPLGVASRRERPCRRLLDLQREGIRRRRHAAATKKRLLAIATFANVPQPEPATLSSPL